MTDTTDLQRRAAALDDYDWAVDRVTRMCAANFVNAAVYGKKLLKGFGYPNETFSYAQDARALKIVLAALAAKETRHDVPVGGCGCDLCKGARALELAKARETPDPSAMTERDTADLQRRAAALAAQHIAKLRDESKSDSQAEWELAELLAALSARETLPDTRCPVRGDENDKRTRCILVAGHDGEHQCPDWQERLGETPDPSALEQRLRVFAQQIADCARCGLNDICGEHAAQMREALGRAKQHETEPKRIEASFLRGVVSSVTTYDEGWREVAARLLWAEDTIAALTQAKADAEARGRDSE